MSTTFTKYPPGYMFRPTWAIIRPDDGPGRLKHVAWWILCKGCGCVGWMYILYFRKLLLLIAKILLCTYSKFKPIDVFFPSVLCVYFYIYFMRQKKLKNELKLGFHCTRHCMNPFFCWHGVYDNQC